MSRTDEAHTQLHKGEPLHIAVPSVSSIGRIISGAKDKMRHSAVRLSPKETFAKVGERDEVQGVCNTGGETYQLDRRASE